MIRSGIVRVGIALAIIAVAVTSCSKQQRQELTDDAAEIAARNIAAEAGAEEFENAGIEVRGKLDCKANSEGGGADLTLRCTGSSTDGRNLVVEGTVATDQGDVEGDEARGTFVGSADGKEVYSENCFGSNC